MSHFQVSKKTIKKAPERQLDQEEIRVLEAQFHSGHFQDVEERLKDLVQRYPSAFYLYNILGLTQMQLGKYKDAIESYHVVLKNKPDHLDSNSNLATAYTEVGNLEEAVQYYQKALHLNPNLILPRKHLGSLLNNLGQFRKAIECFEVLLKHSPQDIDIYYHIGTAYENLSEYDQAIEAYAQAFDKNPKRADICFRLGVVHRKKDDIDAAMKYFQKTTVIMPSFIDAYIELGTLYNNHDKYDQALYAYQKAYAFNPDQSFLAFNIAAVYQNLENFSEAISYYQKALKNEPHNVDFHYRLGTAYSKVNQFLEAAACYQKALQLQPDYSLAYGDLGIAYYNLKTYDEAVANLSKAVEFDPENPKVHFYLGLALMRSKQFEPALKSYEEAIRLNSDYLNAYINIGVIRAMQGDVSLALNAYLKALEIDPDNYLALIYFAETLRSYDQLKVSEAFRKHIITYLQHPQLESMAVNPSSIVLISQDLRSYLFQKHFTYDDLSQMNQKTKGLLNAHLGQSINTNYELEVFFTRVRCNLLDFQTKNSLNMDEDSNLYELMTAVALQSFHNEYIWSISEDETNSIATLIERVNADISSSLLPSLFDLAMIASYQSLYSLDKIRVWGSESYDHLPEDYQLFLKPLLIDLNEEREMRLKIKQFTSIDDKISQNVQSQYEQNPYPRWNSLSNYQAISYIDKILNEINPHEPVLEATTNTPQILIAGCGTGRHPITTALQCENSDVIAIDLSISSLAYAQNKADTFGIKNIQFGQADILKLRELNKTFDVIECGGVLHHMEHPEDGLEVLLDILRPDGFLKLGLYSEFARQHVASIRNKVDYSTINPSLLAIRDFRNSLVHTEHDIHKTLVLANDYYSTSALRDLLLHVQEHRFTVLQLKDMLQRHSLEFLGFTFSNKAIVKTYQTRFPDDPDGVNLDNWHIFETEHQSTFTSMYQFWCRKRS